jgi:prepilin-type N-terminal cleavage/methylation domain-containing protein
MRMRARGFTLIEMVMVIIIMAILAAFIAPILAEAVSAYDAVTRNIEVLTKMRYAMERLSREIRMVRRDPVNSGNYDIVTMVANKLEFCQPDGTGVIISYTSPPNVTIAVTNAGTFNSVSCSASALTARVLTDMATAFTLTYFNAAGGAAVGKNDVVYVQVALTLTGTGTLAYNLSTRVDLRNP